MAETVHLIDLTVNGERHRVEAAPETPLLYVLRNQLKLNSPKYGCGLARCGTCTVICDGQAILACDVPAGDLEGADITTLEGLGTEERLHPVQQAFLDEQAAQCGYCTAGLIVKTVALLEEKPNRSDAELRAELDGNLCRCGSHVRILRAVRKAAVAMGGAP